MLGAFCARKSMTPGRPVAEKENCSLSYAKMMAQHCLMQGGNGSHAHTYILIGYVIKWKPISFSYYYFLHSGILFLSIKTTLHIVHLFRNVFQEDYNACCPYTHVISIISINYVLISNRHTFKLTNID